MDDICTHLTDWDIVTEDDSLIEDTRTHLTDWDIITEDDSLIEDICTTHLTDMITVTEDYSLRGLPYSPDRLRHCY